MDKRPHIFQNIVCSNSTRLYQKHTKMIMKLVLQTKVQEICVCSTKPFIVIRYEYQKVNIQHIREKFSFYVDFQMSQIFEIDPILQLVGSKRKRTRK